MKHFILLAICIFISSVGIKAQDVAEEDLPVSTAAYIGGSTAPVHFLNHFTITPPEGFLLLSAEESKTFLVDICGNPADSAEGVLGCLVPDVEDVYVDGIPYFFVIEDDMSGYVRDNDAADIDYAELMKQMQEYTQEYNAEYRKTHPEYPVVKLVGWAEQPYYDKVTHTLYWGKLFDFQGETKVVNYDMRVLGKDGFVMIQAVGDENDLAELKATGQKMLGCVVFDKGYTYADFDESKDHVAEWTIGGLIAGKILTKVGFWALIAKFWKIILVAIVGGFAGIAGFFSKLFRKKKDDSVDEENSTEELNE